MPKIESKILEYNPDNEAEHEKRKFELNEIDEKIAEILSIINNCEFYVNSKIKDGCLSRNLNLIKRGIADLSILLFDHAEMKVAKDSNLTDSLGQMETLLATLELLKRRTANGEKNMSENEKKLLKSFVSRIEEAEKYLKNLIKDGSILEKELATHEEKHNPDK